MCIAKPPRTGQAPSGAARRVPATKQSHVPLLTELAPGIPPSYSHVAPTGAFTRFVGREILGLLMFSLSALIALSTGCGKKHEPQAAAGESLPPAAVRVQKIETVKQPAVEEVVGTVQPKLQAVIEAKVSGRITRLPVTLGQSVKQGDVLVELATQEIQARLDQANAAFQQAELDFNRTANLRKQSAATQAEFDAVQARYNVAKAAVAEAEALSGYAKILAPFDGVVARKLADEGDLAMPGKPLLELEGRSGLAPGGRCPCAACQPRAAGREARRAGGHDCRTPSPARWRRSPQPPTRPRARCG